MDRSDRVELQDFEAVGHAVALMRRRSLLAAGLGGFLFSAVVVLAWLWLHPGELQAAAFLTAVTYVFFGLPLLVYWIRYWRKIERKLAEVSAQVKAGEVIYGSQVSFR
jgi:hypothetical protein